MTSADGPEPWGYRWRSSTSFTIICIVIALFSETFLFGFIVPLLPHILENRNHVDPSDVQRITYQILTIYGATAFVSGIFIGPLADMVRSRRLSLIIALSVALVGTLLLAASTNLPGVFIGRVLQSMGGAGAWIVGLATLRASIDHRNAGKVFGTVQACFLVGVLSGPAVGGVLLEVVGYWLAWLSVMVILGLDIAMRLVMLEKREEHKPNGQTDDDDDDDDDESGEDHPLLSGAPRQSSYTESTDDSAPETPEPSTMSFYRIILSQRRVLVAMLATVVYSSLTSSFSTTIPTHTKSAFGWGSLPTGLLLASQQLPALILAPVFGWCRDQYGTKLLAGTGFGLLCPIMWLLGAADQEQFPWAATKQSAEHAYIVALVLTGCVLVMASNTASIEIPRVADQVAAKQPGIFGPGRNYYSRCFSLQNSSFSVGMFLGPLLSGTLVDSVGYYYMNSVLACICAVMSVLSFNVLEGRVTT